VTFYASGRTDFWSALGSMIGGIGTTLAFLLGVLVLYDDGEMRPTVKRSFAAGDALGVLRGYDVRVANDSDLPVQDVIIGATFPGERLVVGETRIPHVEARTIEPVPWRKDLMSAMPPSEVDEMPKMPGIWIRFTDAQGRNWSRSLYGEPGRFFYDPPQHWAVKSFTVARSWARKHVRKQPKQP
jgi:hypothetical protein